MKNIKKIGALLLAVVMIMAMSTTAFATSEDLTTTGVVGTNAGTATEKSVSFENVLTAFNPADTTVYAPGVTYSFAIAANTVAADGVGTTITDTDDVTAQVLPGNYSETINGVSYAVSGSPTITVTKDTNSHQGTVADSTLTYAYNYQAADNLIEADVTGETNTGTVTVDFTSVTYPKAGIYRYKVTRTVTGDAVDKSLINQDTNVRYLDVYVKGDGNIYGYTLHELTTDFDGGSNPAPAKSTGFHDTYYTSNVTVGKTLTGDTLMAGHKFPFSVTFSDTTANSGVVSVSHIKVDGTSSTTTTATMAKGDTTNFAKIANGGTVTYYGIPAGVTVSAYESNNVTGTTYQSAVDATATVSTATTTQGAVTAEDTTGKNINWGTRDAYAAYDSTETFSSNVATITTADAEGNDAFTMPFVNTLQLISPTGVMLRVAPYVLMLAAGLFLVLFTRRRREEAEAV